MCSANRTLQISGRGIYDLLWRLGIRLDLKQHNNNYFYNITKILVWTFSLQTCWLTYNNTCLYRSAAAWSWSLGKNKSMWKEVHTLQGARSELGNPNSTTEEISQENTIFRLKIKFSAVPFLKDIPLNSVIQKMSSHRLMPTKSIILECPFANILALRRS